MLYLFVNKLLLLQLMLLLLQLILQLKLFVLLKCQNFFNVCKFLILILQVKNHSRWLLFSLLCTLWFFMSLLYNFQCFILLVSSNQRLMILTIWSNLLIRDNAWFPKATLLCRSRLFRISGFRLLSLIIDEIKLLLLITLFLLTKLNLEFPRLFFELILIFLIILVAR